LQHRFQRCDFGPYRTNGAPSHACRVTDFRTIGGLAGLAGTAAAYAVWIRPRLKNWGATDEEVTGPYPGADLVPGGQRGATMAITIHAAPDRVWPWLVQLGGDRAGWYSWDHLDNGGRPSADSVHPEWQSLAVGDYVKYWTRHGPVDAWEVVALEPARFLGLRGLSDLRGRPLDPDRPRPSAYTEGLWGFLLREGSDGSTRLIIGGYETFRPELLGRVVLGWIFPPVVWVMQARMLSVIKHNVERAESEHPLGATTAGAGEASAGPSRVGSAERYHASADHLSALTPTR
jgi:hypothetical protein